MGRFGCNDRPKVSRIGILDGNVPATGSLRGSPVDLTMPPWEEAETQINSDAVQ
jgi:hypothetical protein